MEVNLINNVDTRLMQEGWKIYRMSHQTHIINEICNIDSVFSCMNCLNIEEICNREYWIPFFFILSAHVLGEKLPYDIPQTINAVLKRSKVLRCFCQMCWRQCIRP